MFGIESKELLIILFAVLIFFGPKRIPEVARALGKGLGDMREALSGMERDVRSAADAATAPGARPVPGVGSIPAAPAEAPPTQGESSGNDTTDSGKAIATRPESDPGPGLAG